MSLIGARGIRFLGNCFVVNWLLFLGLIGARSEDVGVFHGVTPRLSHVSDSLFFTGDSPCEILMVILLYDQHDVGYCLAINRDRTISTEIGKHYHR